VDDWPIMIVVIAGHAAFTTNEFRCLGSRANATRSAKKPWATVPVALRQMTDECARIIVGSTMRRPLLALNAFVSTASIVSAVLSLFRPSMLSNSPEALAGEVFFARMYAARAVPLGIALVFIPYRASRVTSGSVVLLGALIQLLDVGVAIASGIRRMVFGALVGTIAHTICGVAILRGDDPAE